MNVYELVAKISLDSSEYDQGLNESKSKLSSLGSGIAKTALTVARGTGAAVVAGAAAVGAVAKSAISGYADYEQLTGGVETLFGDMSDTVIDNAGKAFETAGMNANDYMETVTSFAASLNQSLIKTEGTTARAADVADLAITDMSDNANKMGTDMASLQGAYQNFAKQNYSMLDNLKLGYSGSKSEMERLVEDANTLKRANGEMATLSIDNFSDVVEAIHTVQTNMGITGTTAKEASTTISGSIGMTKTAWDNLVTGFANDNADIGLLVSNVVDSASTALNNLIPVAKTALTGIGKAIVEVAPVIAENLPVLITTVLPDLIAAGVSLVGSLVASIPTIIMGLIEAVPTVVSSIITAFQNLSGSFTDLGASFVTSMSSGSTGNVADMITSAGDVVNGYLDTALTALPDMVDAGVDFVGNMATGIVNNLPAILTAIAGVIGKLLSTILTHLPDFLTRGMQLAMRIANGIIQNIPKVVSAITQALQKLISTIVSKFPEFLTKGKELVGKIGSGITGAVMTAVNAITTIVNNIKSKITSFDWISAGSSIISGIASGISGAVGTVISAAKSVGSSILGAITGFFEIFSPSHVMRDKVGKMLSKGIAVGFEEESPEDEIVDSVSGTVDRVKASLQGLDGATLGTDINVSAQQPDVENSFVFQNLETRLNSILAALTEYLPYLPGLAQMQIVTDTGVLVGELAPGMDAALGRISARRARGWA